MLEKYRHFGKPEVCNSADFFISRKRGSWVSVFTSKILVICLADSSTLYRSADKSLARPGRKQSTATEDFEFHISYL